MIANDKVIEKFCIINEYCKNLDVELSKYSFLCLADSNIFCLNRHLQLFTAL